MVRDMKRLSVFTTMLATTALLALTAAAPALAEREHVFSASFGDGQLALLPVVAEGRGQIPGSGVAVNQSTHDVYVADTGNHRVVEFSSPGAFIRAWGLNVGGAGVEFKK